MTAARTTRRLPGFRFEAQTPPLAEALPRMDVAVFVGFAASGPLHQPVAVEDVAQFAAVFGEDAPLVWDGRRGETVYAYLAPAVRAFFRNGGRRCWVVRVAGRARDNYFPLPGLARRRANGELAPALARARSEGSWSDSLRAGAALLSRPLIVSRFDSASEFDVELRAPGEVVAGDVLRLTFENGYAPLLVVYSVTLLTPEETDKASPLGRRVRARVSTDTEQWLRAPGSPPVVKKGRAHVLTFDGREREADATVPADSTWGKGQTVGAGEPVTLDLDLPPSQAPALGSVARVELGNRLLWLRVDDVRVLRAEGSSGAAEAVQVAGEAAWVLKNRPAKADLPAAAPICEKLLFQLRVRRGEADPVSISDLGFTYAHPRFWGALPADESFYAPSAPGTLGALGTPAESVPHGQLWLEAGSPRFPLAGFSEEEDAGRVYLPVLMPTLPRHALGPLKINGQTLERDGLAEFGTGLFLDPELKEVRTGDLNSRADFIRYESTRTRPLKGIHAALAVEEATIIVAPDAVHRGWETAPAESLTPQPSPPRPHPEWWRSEVCVESEELPLSEGPPPGQFRVCGLRVVNAPALKAEEPDAAGTLTLDWTGEPGAAYTLEEATAPDWADARAVYTGPNTNVTIYGRSSGNYFYRVRAEAAGSSSNWSNGVGVRVRAASGWRSKPTKAYDPTVLLEVQCALLRICAARGDLFAVLSLPEHYREDESARHTGLLKPSARAAVAGRSLIAPLGYDETRALSFGAVYHPWLLGAAQDGRAGLRRCPPDGAAAGVLAERAFRRGAWVAPANEFLRGVVALEPPLGRDSRQALQDAQVNVIRHEPRGFLAMSADTLSDDADWRPIGVRRLISLIRRLALREGATYVFEPHNDAFHRLVRRGFERMLGLMFTRGAFAGASHETAFRVVTDSTINTRHSMEQGHFVVELKVAPSLPLNFMTVHLVQSGDRGLATEER
ncbi:MAG TPA: hypothetical protein VF659_01935 [Pyrinomonadaceae bacterium]